MTAANAVTEPIGWTQPAWSRIAGVVALVTAKFMDLAVTAIIVLAHRPGLETNPVGRHAIETAGLLGLLALGVGVLAGVVFVVEGGIAIVRRHQPPAWVPIAIRILGYGPLSVWWVAVSAYNILGIAGLVTG